MKNLKTIFFSVASLHTFGELSGHLRAVALFLLFMTLSADIFGQGINVDVLIIPPYSTRLSSYTDLADNNSLVISLENPGLQQRELYLLANIERNGAPFAEMSPDFIPATPIILAPGEIRDFTGMDIMDLNLNFERSDLTGLSPAQIDRIIADDAMPEGDYRICLRAFDFNTRTPISLNGQPSYCSESFCIAQGSRPVIQRPTESEVIDPDLFPTVPFEWTEPTITCGVYDVRYRLKLVDMTEQLIETALDAEAMLNSGVSVLFEEEDLFIPNYEYGLDPIDPELIVGHRYALRITAYELNDLLYFENDGHSLVHTFQYGEPDGGGADCADPNYVINEVYPRDSDTLPFNFVPCLAQVEPLCDDYRRFDFSFNLSGNDGRNYSRTEDNVWSDGPVAYLERRLGRSVTRDRASHFVFNLQLEQDRDIGPLTPGTAYTWSVNTTMTERDGTTHAANTVPQTFIHGMPSPRLRRPFNGTVLDSTGRVQLEWRSGEAPGTLIPNYLDLIRAEGTAIVGQETIGNVFEACVVQLASSPDFEPGRMVGAQKMRLELSNLNQPASAISAALFKEMDHTFSVSDTGTYYWRVVWLQDPNFPLSPEGALPAGRHYHPSPTWQFRIGAPGAGAGGAPEEPTAAAGDTSCVSNCVMTAPASTSPRSSLAVDDEVRVGKFTMKVTRVTNSSGSRFRGEGEVRIPFMNNLRIKVEFNGLGINGEGAMFTGTVVASEDDNPFELASTIDALGNQIPSLPQTELELFNAFLNDGSRLVSALTDARAIGLPVGIDRDVDGHKITLGVVKMSFEPTVAKMDILCALQLPEFDSAIGLGVADWCFNPGGLGSDGRLHLAGDLSVNPEDDVVFKVSGGPDTTRSSYLEFDCDGFVCAQLQFELEFDRSIMLPDTNVVTDPEAEVSASFRFKLCETGRWDFIAQAHLDAFIVPEMNGFIWRDTDLWLDLSDRENPTGFSYPRGYNGVATNSDARIRNTWQGIYIPRIMLQLPRELDESGPPTSLGVDNFIVDFDPGALTFRFAAYNLVGSGEESIDGWGITIDTLYGAMIQNRDLAVGMDGRLEMPITDEGEFLKYHALLNTSGFELGVSVDPREGFTAPIMAANLELARNTFLRLHLGANSFVEARLNGTISISGDIANNQSTSGSASPGMSMPGIRFQDVYFHTGTGASSTGTWSEASPQKSVGGFPLQIDSIGLDFSDMRHPGFFIKPRLTLMGGDGGIGAAAMLHFYANVDDIGNGIEKIRLERVELSEINLDVTISSVSLKGYIRWRNTGTVEEVAGGIDVTVPMGIRGKLECVFGTYKASETAAYDTPDYYSYWLVDGLIQFNPGLQIFSGFAIYGIGGGVYHHMRLDPTQLATAVRGTPATPGGEEGTPVSNTPQRSSSRYERHYETSIGLQFTLIMGTFPKPDAFNMDITLGAEFNNHGGLNLFRINGAGYVMTGLDDRASDNKMLWATLDIVYQAQHEQLDGNFDVYLDVKDILVGRDASKRMVHAVMHVDPSMWYFYMGTYDDPGGIRLTIPGMGDIFRLDNYLMIGHGVPVELPPIRDQQLHDLLYAGRSSSGGGSNYVDSDEAEILGARNDGWSADAGNIRTGKGFAFGTSMVLETSINPIPLYLDFRMALGMDILVSQAPPNLICAETGTRPGINGWRAQGQIYAGVWGELGIGVKIIRRFTIPIVSLAAGFILKAKLPNPNYFAGDAAVQYSVLGGAIRGRKTFSFEFGEDCTLVGNDPLRDVQVLEDVGPSGNVEVYTDAVATFNVPINRRLEIPRSIPDDAPPTFWVFYPFIHSWTIKDQAGATVACKAPYSENQGYSARLEPIEVLQGNHNYRTEIEIRFRDQTNGTNVIYRNPNNGQIHKEEDDDRFRTGARPETIPHSQVKYSYPVHKQRFFLPEVSNYRGAIEMSRGHGYLFYPQRGGDTYKYVARYVPLAEPASGTSIEDNYVDVPLNYRSGRTIYLNLPRSLEPETIYAVQIIRVRNQNQQDRFQESLAGMGITNGNGMGIHPSVQANLMRNVRVNFAGGDYVVMRRARQVNHTDVRSRRYETKLYQFYFRTSKHRNLNQKLASLNLTGHTPLNGYGRLGAETFGQISEHFDEFEINGVYWRGTRVLSPLVRFNPYLSDEYYQWMQQGLYTPWSQLTRLRKVRATFTVGGSTGELSLRLPAWPRLYLFSALTRRDDWCVRIDPAKSWVRARLSEQEINSAATITPTLPAAPGNTFAGNNNFGNNLGGLSPMGGFTLSGGLTANFTTPVTTSTPRNFTLKYFSADEFHRDHIRMINHISALFAATVTVAGMRKTVRQIMYENHRGEFYLANRLRLLPWTHKALIDNETPMLPVGSEFA
ncbi:MAG: hypothetical protein AAGF89_00415, partial [Bacteroidota bacterium]